MGVFRVSAMYGGIAGSLLMFDRPFASEVQFGTRLGIFLLVGLVAGGVGTAWGAVVGAFVYLFVPYFATQWTFDQSGMPPGLRQLTSPLFQLLDSAGERRSGSSSGSRCSPSCSPYPAGSSRAFAVYAEPVITVEPDPTWLVIVAGARSGPRARPRSTT